MEEKAREMLHSDTEDGNYTSPHQVNTLWWYGIHVSLFLMFLGIGKSQMEMLRGSGSGENCLFCFQTVLCYCILRREELRNLMW